MSFSITTRIATTPVRNPHPAKVGIVVVDMLEPCRDLLTYRHSSLRRLSSRANVGIKALVDFLRTVRELGLPVFLIKYSTDISTRDVMPEILSVSGTHTMIFGKTKRHAFSTPSGDHGFDAHLKLHGISDLVICGFNRSACVLDTVRAALIRGYRVHTSDQLLFGNKIYDREREIRSNISFLRTATFYYESVDDLVEALRTLSALNVSGG